MPVKSGNLGTVNSSIKYCSYGTLTANVLARDSRPFLVSIKWSIPNFSAKLFFFSTSRCLTLTQTAFMHILFPVIKPTIFENSIALQVCFKKKNVGRRENTIERVLWLCSSLHHAFRPDDKTLTPVSRELREFRICLPAHPTGDYHIPISIFP